MAIPLIFDFKNVLQKARWEQVSISIDGETIAVGAWRGDSLGQPDSGNAKVFTLARDQWEQLGNTIVGESRGGGAGYSVSLSSGQ